MGDRRVDRRRGGMSERAFFDLDTPDQLWTRTPLAPCRGGSGGSTVVTREVPQSPSGTSPTLSLLCRPARRELDRPRGASLWGVSERDRCPGGSPRLLFALCDAVAVIDDVGERADPRLEDQATQGLATQPQPQPLPAPQRPPTVTRRARLCAAGPRSAQSGQGGVCEVGSVYSAHFRHTVVGTHRSER